MKRRIVGLAVLVGAFTFGGAARADIIFDNGVPDLNTGSFSDLNFPMQIADDFRLAAGANTLSGVNWWGFYSWTQTQGPPPLSDDFTIRVFRGVGGLPSATPIQTLQFAADVNRSLVGTLKGYDLYSYSVDVNLLTLTPGDSYFLSIINNTPSTTADWAWATSVGSPITPTNGTYRATDSDSWRSFVAPRTCAFNLTDDVVPEPSTLAIFLGLGGMGLIAAWRRRKRAA